MENKYVKTKLKKPLLMFLSKWIRKPQRSLWCCKWEERLFCCINSYIKTKRQFLNDETLPSVDQVESTVRQMIVSIDSVKRADDDYLADHFQNGVKSYSVLKVTV